MPGLRGEELWAAACIEEALPGVDVRQHDDGSGRAMYDLSVHRGGHEIAAVEVTAAADPESIALWKLINGNEDRWQEPELVGGWFVCLLPTARAKVLQRQLPDLLRALELAGRTELAGDRHADLLSRRAAQLNIVSARQVGTTFPGSIYVTIELPTERSGGIVASTGDALADWLGRWAQEPQQGDSLRKLESARAPERHLFVLLPGFTTAPFSVADLLMRDGAPLPTISPAFPSFVSHAWTMSTWSTGDVLSWSSADGWRRSRKVTQVRTPP